MSKREVSRGSGRGSGAGGQGSGPGDAGSAYRGHAAGELLDDELQRRYLRWLAARPPRDRAACPAPGAIRALVERHGAEADRLATLDHVMACPACRADFELLRTLERAGAAIGAVPSARHRAGPMAARWLALAASVLLVLGGVLWLRRADEPGVLRGAETAVRLVEPRGELPAGAAPRLVWRAVPGAVGYRIEVLDEAGEPVAALATGSPGDTVAPLPAGALRPGGRYQWWVRARLADGSELRSGFQSFRLRAP